MSDAKDASASIVDEVEYIDGKRLVKRTFTSKTGASHVLVEHASPDATRHYYSAAGLNTPIILYSGNFGFDGDANADWTGDVQFRWLPHPRVVAQGERAQDAKELLKSTQYDSSDAVWVDMPKVVVPASSTLPPSSGDVYPGWSRSSGSSYVDENLQPTEVGDGSALDRITFLLPNGWFSSDGSWICDPDNLWHRWRGRLSLSHGGWDIVVDARSDMSNPDFRKALKESGGYCATHIGEVSRTSGEKFDAVEAEDLLEILRLAFTFACGRTVNPVLPVGWKQDQAVWALWAGPNVDPYRTVATWIDPVGAMTQVADVIKCMLDYCGDPFKREIVRYAISYLTTANFDLDAELAVAVPISGLQLLAHHRLVEELHTHSPAAFERLDTEPQIRLLLEDCSVDMSLPDHLGYLAVAQASIPPEPNRPLRDALGTAVFLRNKIIHPTKKNPSNWSVYSWYEASMVSRYYLTLAILNTIGYAGTHHSMLSKNRWVGAVTLVPWATTPGSGGA
ncbi:hypothetical protein EV138_3025 [Kribbella voronezhensis]|uniref:YopA central domain-containing protein n=1 Tax=Kribbella voronezhensis TaxID=2512212 RepID=A0A4R7TDM5_9ACTN|nr:hypothetical protein [Kribbella voronezhensis]TDU89457.1 hypothetical protein EV138_3025 [Kribbella voronezhensis]